MNAMEKIIRDADKASLQKALESLDVYLKEKNDLRLLESRMTEEIDGQRALVNSSAKDLERRGITSKAVTIAEKIGGLELVDRLFLALYLATLNNEKFIVWDGATSQVTFAGAFDECREWIETHPGKIYDTRTYKVVKDDAVLLVGTLFECKEHIRIQELSNAQIFRLWTETNEK